MQNCIISESEIILSKIIDASVSSICYDLTNTTLAFLDNINVEYVLKVFYKCKEKNDISY